ncbi:thiosulfate reductase cytochrome b subunit [Kushneria sinocarnis]|uniref:Thiosulfate reductase cytochrome b subunit n=1 Tax=Kushneria sinocarnis TaxID=595502 RepID=A0A420WW23_9GAMM|nr:cytochrome b/b6 domain-containing protein [Kushneria sinocarnis]RKR03314.1 thiosulfate reductase cytochrome b subunit [Kushneria sinocarnis]
MRAASTAPPSSRPVRRHALPVRLWHWFNLWCLVVLLMSGLQIFNAHPALYWGSVSNFDDPWLEMYAIRASDGAIEGVTALGPWQFETTGVLGYSSINGQQTVRGFPAWATLPSHQFLSMGRLWHFFFGWLFAVSGALFVLHAVISGHLRRDLWPAGREWRGLGRDMLNHLKFRFHDHAGKYNSLQKLSYAGVIFAALPLMIVTGLCMSPTVNAAAPWLLDLFGGRQSARSLHFIIAGSLVLFVIVHVLLVLLTHPLRQLRGMITGRAPERHGSRRTDGHPEVPHE